MKSISPYLSRQAFSRHDDRTLRARNAFPQMNYQYQSTAEAPATGSIASRPTRVDYAAQMRSFRQLSEPIIGEDRHFPWEATALGLVIAIVAWPLTSLLIVLIQTARG